MVDVSGSTAFFAYVGAYTVATVGCLLALGRATQVQDGETRRGLVGLLVGSGGWAALELGFLVAPNGLKYGLYLASLVVGLTTVGAWLYFCSAYTGRSFHRNANYRRLAVAVYLAIVVVKLTNPYHGLYFTTAPVTEPFPHITIVHGTFHWVVTGLSYALVAVGFFMLYEMFLDADYDTRPLGALVGVTAIPVVLDIVGYAYDGLIDINYEPLGVVVFAVGVLFVFEEQFLAVQVTDGVEDPVVYLDDDGRIREFNGRAKALFGVLAGSRGAALDDVLPAVSDALAADDPILELERAGETAYYLVSDTGFSLGQSDIGRMIVLSDVSESERTRRELDRQNEQLEGFAAAIRHELLNTLQVISARIAIAGEALEAGEVERARESLVTASETSDRMSGVVDDLARLARQGQTLDQRTETDLVPLAESAWERVDTDGMTLTVDVDGTVLGDPNRVRNLFESAFAFAAHNGAATVTVEREADELLITGDGEPPGETSPESFFEYGSATPDAEAGLKLPNLRTLAQTHGWDATIDTNYDDGVRIVVTGVTRPERSGGEPTDPTRR